MQKDFRFGPLALTTTMGTNILNPGTTTGGIISTGAPYSKLAIVLYHIRIVNTNVAERAFSLWLGASGDNAAGTEVIGTAKAIAPNDVEDWNGRMRLDTTDFLVGGGSAAGLVIQGEGWIFVA